MHVGLTAAGRGILGLLDRMAGKLPCYELDFLPDKKIIDFVKNI